MIENIDDILDVIKGIKDVCRFTDCSHCIFKSKIIEKDVHPFKGLCMFHSIPSAWKIGDIKQNIEELKE